MRDSVRASTVSRRIKFKYGLMQNAADASWLMVQSGGFQQQVNVSPAPGVAGDFCSNNPRFTVDAGPGGLVAGPSGVIIGNFAWFGGPVDLDGTPTQVYSYWPGYELSGWTAGQSVNQIAGFVGRNQQGLITTFLSDASMVIPQGFPMFLYSGGDFWVKNAGTVQALPGMKAYASLSNGSVNFNTTGNPAQAASIQGTIAPETATFTASIAGNLMTVTAIATGGAILFPGMTLAGTAGGTISSTASITFQVSGSVGGTGVYTIGPAEETYASATVTGSIGLLTTGTLTSGTLGVGQVLSGTAAAPNTVITALGTGTGGVGTYYVTPSQTLGNTAFTTPGSVETKWIAMSSGLTGELVKISSHSYG